MSDKGLPEKIAPDRVDWLEAACRRARFAQRADRGLISIDRDHSRSFGKPQRKWAHAGKEISNAPCRTDMRSDKARERCLAFSSRL